MDFKGERFIPEHSVKKLIKKCTKYDRDFAKFEQVVSVFDQYYIPTRYPEAVAYPEIPYEIYTEKQAKEAVDIAKKLHKFINSKMVKSNSIV